MQCANKDDAADQMRRGQSSSWSSSVTGAAGGRHGASSPVAEAEAEHISTRRFVWWKWKASLLW